jgi:hypothetical protein
MVGSQTAACKRYSATLREWSGLGLASPALHGVSGSPLIGTILPWVFLVRCAPAAVAAVAVSAGGPGGSPDLTPVALVGLIVAAVTVAKAARAVPTAGLNPSTGDTSTLCLSTLLLGRCLAMPSSRKQGSSTVSL